MEARVIDEIHLKCIIEWKDSHCYSNELRLICSLDNTKRKMSLVCTKVFKEISFCFQGGCRLHQPRCEKFHSRWRPDLRN